MRNDPTDNQVPFEKWHGLGNDFIIIWTDQPAHALGPARAVKWCDRHTGVGADGVLLLSQTGENQIKMTVFNADGSIPETCGNGIRCAAQSWMKKSGAGQGFMVVESGAALNECESFPDGQVSVAMGPPRLRAEHLPSVDKQAIGPIIVSVELGGRQYDGVALSMGNPHLVLFGEDWDSLSEEEARRLEQHDSFSQNTNVSFVVVTSSDSLELKVWERGCGFTNACGSGACAAVTAACLLDLCTFDLSIKVSQPGGDLHITALRDLSQVWMKGAAEFVYSGFLQGLKAP